MERLRCYPRTPRQVTHHAWRGGIASYGLSALLGRLTEPDERSPDAQPTTLDLSLVDDQAVDYGRTAPVRGIADGVSLADRHVVAVEQDPEDTRAVGSEDRSIERSKVGAVGAAG